MVPLITSKPILIPASSRSNVVEEGLLIFADDQPWLW